MSLTTEMREEIRALQANGWSVTKTAGGHWRCTHPDVERPLFTSGSPSDWRSVKNFRAEVKRALRGTTTEQEDESMQTETAMEPISHTSTAPKAEPWQPQIRVYRTPASVGKPQAELVLGEREAAHLGGDGARVSFEPGANGAWRLMPDDDGQFSLVHDGRNFFRVRSQAFAAALPPTGRTEIPARVDGDGFLVFPAEVVPVATRLRSDGADTRKPAERVIPPKIKRAMLDTVDMLHPPRGKAPSLDDLKTALEMLRTIATELGAELFLDVDTGELRAKITL
jgi:hypothetical protein